MMAGVHRPWRLLRGTPSPATDLQLKGCPMALNNVGATIGGVLKNLIVAVDVNGNIASAHTTIDQNGAPVVVAQDGTDASGVTMPPGGVGIRGWLSGSYGLASSILAAVTGILRVNVQNTSFPVTGAFFQATQPVSATTLPLPTGAADAATLAAVNSKLAALLAVEQPFQGAIAMVVGTAQPAQRAVRINCTVAGNVGLTYVDGSTDVIPVNVGLSYIAGAITTINSAGTTATATYATMK